jgi:hypothetical protein
MCTAYLRWCFLCSLCPWLYLCVCVRLQVERGPGGGPLLEALEAKGLDMVRRDWCPLSKDTGNYALQQILSGELEGGWGGAVTCVVEHTAAVTCSGWLAAGS